MALILMHTYVVYLLYLRSIERMESNYAVPHFGCIHYIITCRYDNISTFFHNHETTNAYNIDFAHMAIKRISTVRLIRM